MEQWHNQQAITKLVEDANAAAKGGHLEELIALLDSGVRIDSKEGLTIIAIAAQHGHLNMVKYLLDRGGSDLISDKAVILASTNGHLEVLKLFLELDLSIEFQSPSGFTMLSAASLHGQVETVKMLLDKGARVEYPGFTPLFAAAQEGRLEVMKMLLERGANINWQSAEGDAPGDTALHYAALSGQLEAVKLLLERGASIDLQSTNGSTPLIVAAENSELEVVKTLIDKGANIDHQNADGHTALYFTSHEGQLEVVKILLENGATVDIQSKNGFTPLVGAAQNGHLEVVKALLDKGANIDHQNNKGHTPLIFASGRGHLEVVKILLEKGANANVQATSGYSAFFYASTEGRLEIVKIFLAMGRSLVIDIGTSTYALSTAAKNGHFDVVKLLLENSVPFVMKSYQQATMACLHAYRFDLAGWMIQGVPHLAKDVPAAMHLAIRSNNSISTEVLKLLIYNGAILNWVFNSFNPIENDPTSDDFKDLGGDIQLTPLHLAVIHKQPIKVWLLVLHGADLNSIHNYFNYKTTVWDLCEGDSVIREALLHFWTPRSHGLHPRWIKEAIACVLLVAKRQRWPLDQHLMYKILSYVAYGWHLPKFAAGMNCESNEVQ